MEIVNKIIQFFRKKELKQELILRITNDEPDVVIIDYINLIKQ